MRTAIAILSLVLAATGCVTDELAESETSSDLTFNYTSPALEFSANLVRMRRSADDLRAVLAATKPPVNPTWTGYLKYRSLVTFLADSANELDTSADQFQAEADAAIQAAAKAAVYEDIENMMADMQAKMDDKLAVEHYEYSFTWQTTSVADIIRRLFP